MLRKKKKDPLVVQANCLIGACLNLTLNEHKILRYILSKVYNKDEKGEGLRDNYKFLVSEMQDTLEGVGGSHIYTDILKHLKSLRDTSFCVHDIKLGEKLQVSWITSFSYTTDENSEDYRKYINVSISKKLQPYLQNLGDKAMPILYDYSKYKLKDIPKMTSMYSLVLYEAFLKELKGRASLEYNLSLSDFRELVGVGVNQYSDVSHLKERVIHVSVEEINEYTDLTVSCSYVKKGAKIIGVKFSIRDTSILRRLVNE
jgi:plasmid replication initiation protein